MPPSFAETSSDQRSGIKKIELYLFVMLLEYYQKYYYSRINKIHVFFSFTLAIT
jgi:hypothetical protein